MDKLNIDELKNILYSSRNLKRKLEKFDVYKLVPATVDLSKLSDVVNNDVVKKDVYNVNTKDIEGKIPDITNLASNTTFNAKVNEVKNEISSIMNLSTIASLLLSTTFNEVKAETPVITNLSAIPAFTNVANKIPNFRDLFKKTDYDAKMSEMEKKYFSTSYYNKFTSNTLDVKITQKKLK